MNNEGGIFVGDLIGFINSVDLKNIFWLVPIVLLLHELEEWNILKWYEDNYVDTPASTNLSIRTWLIVFSLCGFLWTTISYFIPNQSLSALVMFVLVAVTVQNGLQHIYWLLYFKRYAPGVVFSGLFGIPLAMYFTYRTLAAELFPVWLIFLATIAMLPGLIETVRVGNKMTKSIGNVHEFSIRLSNRFSNVK